MQIKTKPMLAKVMPKSWTLGLKWNPSGSHHREQSGIKRGQQINAEKTSLPAKTQAPPPSAQRQPTYQKNYQQEEQQERKQPAGNLSEHNGTSWEVNAPLSEAPSGSSAALIRRAAKRVRDESARGAGLFLEDSMWRSFARQPARGLQRGLRRALETA